jgi:cystathionine beta-lyase
VNNKDSFGNFANRSSSKWRRYPADVLPMHVAEMDFDVAPAIRDRIKDLADRSDLGYTGPIPEVAKSFEVFALDRWGWQIAPEQLKLATDVGVAAVEILRVLTKPGDKVLVNSPVYSSFYHWIEEVHAEVADAPLVLKGDDWVLDLAAIEDAFKDGVKVYMLCSPQNPVGRVHTAKELTQVAELADKYGVTVISDEIHAPLSWVPFTPYLALGPAAERTGVVITSSSKAWNVAGLKAAFLLTQGSEVQARLKGIPEAMHWRTSLIGAFAMESAFLHSVDWLDDAVVEIQQNLAFFQHEVAKKLPKAKLFNLESTYLVWVDLSAYHVDNIQQVLLQQAKVAVVPGEDHAPQDQYSNFVRFNIAASQPRISEAVTRMSKVLEG